jgi:hypothetical protein
VAEVCQNALANPGPFTGDASMPDTTIAWLHVALGGVAVVALPVVIIAAKGGAAHRLAGKVFFWSILGSSASAIWMSLAANDLFLLLLGVLTFYLVVSGYRALYLKRPVPRDTLGPMRPGPLDKGMAHFTLLTCCALVAWGILSWRVDSLAPVMIGLGLLGAMVALGDMKRFRAVPDDASRWLITHAARMLAGATIAATAVGVVHLTPLPELARWLVPAGIGAFGIAIWVILIKRRVIAEGDPRSFVTVRIGEPEPDVDPD